MHHRWWRRMKTPLRLTACSIFMAIVLLHNVAVCLTITSVGGNFIYNYNIGHTSAIVPSPSSSSSSSTMGVKHNENGMSIPAGAGSVGDPDDKLMRPSSLPRVAMPVPLKLGNASGIWLSWAALMMAMTSANAISIADGQADAHNDDDDYDDDHYVGDRNTAATIRRSTSSNFNKNPSQQQQQQQQEQEQWQQHQWSSSKFELSHSPQEDTSVVVVWAATSQLEVKLKEERQTMPDGVSKENKDIDMDMNMDMNDEEGERERQRHLNNLNNERASKRIPFNKVHAHNSFAHSAIMDEYNINALASSSADDDNEVNDDGDHHHHLRNGFRDKINISNQRNEFYGERTKTMPATETETETATATTVSVLRVVKHEAVTTSNKMAATKKLKRNYKNNDNNISATTSTMTSHSVSAFFGFKGVKWHSSAAMSTSTSTSTSKSMRKETQHDAVLPIPHHQHQHQQQQQHKRDIQQQSYEQQQHEQQHQQQSHDLLSSSPLPAASSPPLPPTKVMSLDVAPTLLHRRKRYLVFPESSSFQLIFDLIIPIVDYTNFAIMGITCAVAWELPSKPPSEIIELVSNKLNDGTLGLQRRKDTVISGSSVENPKIAYVDHHKLQKQKTNTQSHFPSSPSAEVNRDRGWYVQDSAKWSNLNWTRDWQPPKKWSGNYLNQRQWTHNGKWLEEHWKQPAKWKQHYYHPKENPKVWSKGFWATGPTPKSSLLLPLSLAATQERGRTLTRPPHHRIYPVFLRRRRRGISTTLNEIKIGGKEKPTVHSLAAQLEVLHLREHLQTRRKLYTKIEKLYRAQDHNGTACVLRALCETGQRSPSLQRQRREQFPNRHHQSEPQSFITELLRAIFTLPEEAARMHSPAHVNMGINWPSHNTVENDHLQHRYSINATANEKATKGINKKDHQTWKSVQGNRSAGISNTSGVRIDFTEHIDAHYLNAHAVGLFSIEGDRCAELYGNDCEHSIWQYDANFNF